MPLIDFLQQVLPRQGKRCAVQITKNKKATQTFHDTDEELAAKVLEISAAGHDAYFACATYKDGSSRRGANALACRTFWLDIDCGEGKPYASADIGIQAVDALAEKLGLPYPMVVRSGRGVHAYWQLRQDISANEWLSISKSLKLVAEQCGLYADPSRTADIASILRPPGTYNYKYTPVLVETQDDEIEEISAQEFAEKLALAHPNQVPSPVAGNITCSVANAILGSMRASAILPAAEGGRNTACTKFVGGLAVKGMQYSQILAEARAWNEKCQPPMDDTEVISVVNSITRREAQKPAQVIGFAEEVRLRPLLPLGFSSVLGKPMFFTFETLDAAGNISPKTVPFIAHECILLDVCRKERENKESYVFEAYHPHNGWHQFQVKREEFESPAWIGIMGSNCCDIIQPKIYKQYVHAAAIEMKGQKMDAIRYEQFGWKDNYSAFLVGNALIKKGGAAEYAYGDEHLEPRMRGMKLIPNSALQAWSSAANRLFAPGFEAHGFGLIASFAAPLMAFVCGATDGGAVLALHTTGSGFGKSNVLQAIASVWGSYDSLGISGSDTENAMFNIISKACHLPAYIEELGKTDPVKETNFLKRYVNGKDKNRSRRDGSVEYKNTRFQNILISASNHSLADILRMGGDQGAMARVFEINVGMPEDKEAFKEFSKLCATLLENHGHAGRAYIYALMQPGVLDWARRELDSLVLQYIKLLETSAKDRYIIYLIAACKIAAKLVNAAGILSFDTDRVMQWAMGHANARVKENGFDSSIEILNQFINENMTDCLVLEGPFVSKKPAVVIRHPRNKVIMRLEKSNGKLFVPAQTLRKWFDKNNAHGGTVQRDLQKAGILKNYLRQMTLGAGTDYPHARLICWEIDMHQPEVSGMLAMAHPNPGNAEHDLASNS